MKSRDSHLTQSDLFAWNMEHNPILRSTIVAVLVLDAEPDRQQLAEILERATRLVPRLRQVLNRTPLGLTPPRWTPDPCFDLSWHMRRIAVPPPHEVPTVLEFAATEITTAFDPVRPLWTFTVLTGLDEGRCAAVVKMHHSLTDGIGGIQIAQALLALPHGRDLPDHGATGTEPARGVVGDILAWQWSTGYGLMRGGFVAAATGTRRAMRDPVGAARDGIRIGLSLARFARPVRSTRSPVMTGRGLGRRLLVRDIPLADLSAAAQRAGCTLNDAYLAALLLALRDYHTRHGVEVPALRTTMPISVRSADDDIGGNHITLARFDLPTDIDDPIELMRAVHRVVDRWRREPAIGWSEALAAMFNRLPNAVLADMLAHVDFVASNVPGSPVPLHLAGAEIRRLYAFAPTLGAAFNAALVSHVDTCHIGIDLDTTAVSDPDTFAASLDAGLHMLLAAPATARE